MPANGSQPSRRKTSAVDLAVLPTVQARAPASTSCSQNLLPLSDAGVPAVVIEPLPYRHLLYAKLHGASAASSLSFLSGVLDVEGLNKLSACTRRISAHNARHQPLTSYRNERLVFQAFYSTSSPAPSSMEESVLHSYSYNRPFVPSLLSIRSRSINTPTPVAHM